MAATPVSSRKARASTNEAGGRLSVNEQVLRDIRAAYVGGDQQTDTTLVAQAEFLRTSLLNEAKHTKGALLKELQQEAEQMRKVVPPPERITIMLIGNHSAGKSSFVNWYVDEHIQKTSEAVETTGITIIRRGKQKTTWKGDLTFVEYPHLKDLEQIPGLKENIRCEISCSNEKQFPLIDFIDTPGLTDGTLEYPFDVDRVILGLAEYSHMILLFLDPHKQALCRRTMNVVKRLGEHHAAKMRFFLARSDALTSEGERADIITQCTQELVKNLHVTHGFKLAPIYLPKYKTPTSGPNKIEETCMDIQKEIESRIQDALNKWKRDCDLLRDSVDRATQRNSANVTKSVKAWVWKFVLGIFFLLVLGATLAASMMHVEHLECAGFGVPAGICRLIHSSTPATIFGVGGFLLVLLLIFGFFKTRTAPTAPGSTKKRWRAIQMVAAANIKSQEACVKQFMQQSLN